MKASIKTYRPTAYSTDYVITISARPWPKSFKKALAAAAITVGLFLAWMGLVITDLPEPRQYEATVSIGGSR